MSARRAAAGLPPDLRAALADGWQGLTLLTDAPREEPVTLLCAVSAGRLRRLDVRALALTLPCPVRPARLVVFSFEEAPAPPAGPCGCLPRCLSVGIDLAYPEARTLLGRLADTGRLRVVWTAHGGTPGARTEDAHLAPPARAALHATIARAGEWHVDTPLPVGLDPEHWAAACADPPRLVEAGFAEGPVALVLPVGTIEGLDGRPGWVAFASGSSRGVRPGGLEVLVRGDAPGATTCRAVVSLGEPAQRRLARRLAGQRQMIVMAADGDRTPSGHLRVAISPSSRVVIARAAAS